jgi:hypothetical protein
MMKPSINVNGTSQKELMQSYIAAINALRVAEELLSKAAPNGRDYATLGDGAYIEARTEHNARCARIADTIKELEQIALHVRRSK